MWVIYINKRIIGELGIQGHEVNDFPGPLGGSSHSDFSEHLLVLFWKINPECTIYSH